MKRRCIIILLIFIFFSGFTQNFGGGVILGVSSSQVNGDDLGGFNKTGLLIGGFANKAISQLFTFQMEMNYIMKGSNNKNMTNIEHKDYLREDISLSYIEIPLLLQYQKNQVIELEGGVLLGYLIDGFYNDINGKLNNSINPFIEYDLGAILGLTYKHNEKIHANTRLSSSIIPIGKEDYENNQAYNSSRKGKYNAVLSLAIHYNL